MFTTVSHIPFVSFITLFFGDKTLCDIQLGQYVSSGLRHNCIDVNS